MATKQKLAQHHDIHEATYNLWHLPVWPCSAWERRQAMNDKHRLLLILMSGAFNQSELRWHGICVKLDNLQLQLNLCDWFLAFIENRYVYIKLIDYQYYAYFISNVVTLFYNVPFFNSDLSQSPTWMAFT